MRTAGGRRTATFSFASDDPAATFACSLDGAAFAPCTSPAAYDADGVPHAFRVRATGAGGTDATPSERRFTIDTTPPEISVLMPAADGSIGANPFAIAAFDAAR